MTPRLGVVIVLSWAALLSPIGVWAQATALANGTRANASNAVVATGGASACVNDGEAPVVGSLGISPRMVDVTSNPANISVQVSIADGGAPIDLCSASFRSANRRNTQFVALSERRRECTADGKGCTLRLSGTFPKHLVSEAWNLELSCRDTACSPGGAPNGFTMAAEQLAALGFDPAVTVRSGKADLEPPVLTSFVLSPRELKVDDDPEVVRAEMVVQDDVSGVESCLVTLRSPQVEVRATMEGDARCTADRTTCNYTLTAEIFANSPTGDWRPALFCRDAVQNTLLMTEDRLAEEGVLPVTVTTTAPDATPPSLLHFSLNTSTVNVREAGAVVEATAVVLDTSSRLADCTVMLHSPDGRQLVVASQSSGSCSADRKRCTYVKRLSLPRGAAVGTWRPTLLCGDVLQNRGVWSPDALQALGFATSLEVHNTVNDREPPVLQGVRLSPAAVDVGSAPAAVSLSIAVADARSGIEACMAVLHSPAESSLPLTASGPPECHPGGVNAAGWASSCDYHFAAVIPNGAPAGEWALTLACSDSAGNGFALWDADIARLGLQSALAVASSPSSDSEPPTLSHFQIRKGPQTVSATLSVQDAGSSIDGCVVVFIHDSLEMLFLDVDSRCDVPRHACDFGGASPLPTLAGRWSAAVSCADIAGNSFTYRAPWLGANGFDSAFEVANASSKRRKQK